MLDNRFFKAEYSSESQRESAIEANVKKIMQNPPNYRSYEEKN